MSGTADQDRARRSKREPSEREKTVLRLLSEQGAIPTDQLSRFLGVGEREAKKIVKALEQDNCLRCRRLLSGEEPWVWLRHRGARLSETGFAASEPAISRLAHTRAINEARLYVTRRAPQGNWICERALRRGYRQEGNIPDAVFEIEAERHAIEVELTPKTAARVRAIVAEHSARYDAVVYFCSPSALSLLKRVKEERPNPKLFVRKLPPVPGAKAEARRGEGKSKSTAAESGPEEPRPQKTPILNLLADQGAIPLDQLSRFLDCDEAEAERIVSGLHEEGLIHRKHPLAAEPDWLWLTKRGAGLSERQMSAPRPKIGSLALMRATNEVRLIVARRTPRAGWIPRRALLHELGPNAAVPRAVVELDGERHAIEVRLAPGLESRLVQLIRRRSADYDLVVCFCTPKARRQLERMKERQRWPKLVLGNLPAAG